MSGGSAKLCVFEGEVADHARRKLAKLVRCVCDVFEVRLSSPTANDLEESWGATVSYSPGACAIADGVACNVCMNIC